MGNYDSQQVCLNGHQITDAYHASPQFRRDFCGICGAKTIYRCPSCAEEIKGDYHATGVIAVGSATCIPTFCEGCGEKFPWTHKQNDGVTSLVPAVSVERVCKRIPLVVRQLRIRHDGRAAHEVEDEYDLQDVLHALLLLFFDDVRPEEYTPSYAGKSSRMDFLLKECSIVIEAKMTRKGLGAREVGEQLLLDIARYREHPSCRMLYCLVYDPEHRIANPRGLEMDLSKNHEHLDVRVFIVPTGV